MIYAIVGRPGGGKSYESVAFHVIPALKAGRMVITNLTLNVERLAKVYGEHVRDLIVVIDGQLDEFGRVDRPFSKVEHYQDQWQNDKGQGPLYLIDEAHMSVGRQAKTDLTEWYSLHRHSGCDIVLMTQNLRKIHRDIKDIVEITYQCTKATALGDKTRYIRKVRDGAAGDVVNEGIRKYESAYFQFYKSHTMSNKAVEEASAQDIVPFWKRWPVIGSAICFAIGIVFNVYLWTSGDEVPIQSPTSTIEAEESTSEVEPKPDKRVRKFPKNSSGFGPLEGFTFYVKGYAHQIAYSSYGSGASEISRDLTFFKIYIDVYQDKRKLFSTNNLNLVQMGYEFNALAECVYSLVWLDETKVITCSDEEEDRNQTEENLFDRVPSFST